MVDPAALAEGVLDADTRALARAITLAEAGHEAVPALLSRVYERTGRAVTVGVTGFPGAGKSSLVDQLVARYRARGQRVGVVAVDPSSAFSGGAILGDRVRMMRHAGDPGVFIRSMATRGHLGGLARASGDAIDLLDAAGFDVVLVETLGVGQDEIDVAGMTDAVVVVLVPGMGDDIQAIKAGVLEIADLFVINKADREGAEKLAAEMRQMLSLTEDRAPRTPILKTVAIRGDGVEELVAAIDRHLERLEREGGRRERRRRRAEQRLQDLAEQELLRRAIERGVGARGWDDLVDRVASRETDPYAAVSRLIERAVAGRGDD